VYSVTPLLRGSLLVVSCVAVQNYVTLVIDRIAGEMIRLVASVCVRVCVRPFVCGRSPV